MDGVFLSHKDATEPEKSQLNILTNDNEKRLKIGVMVLFNQNFRKKSQTDLFDIDNVFQGLKSHFQEGVRLGCG
jgi:hypothetical protein